MRVRLLRSAVTLVSSQESFKTSWRGWVRSSEGYSLRVGSRTGIHWRDVHGTLQIESEVMSDPTNEVVVYTGSIPDNARASASGGTGAVARAFDHMGSRLTLEDAWFD